MTTSGPQTEAITTASLSNNEIDELIQATTGINYVEIIETVIDSLEQNDTAMVSQTTEGGYLWKFQYGSAEIFVQLTGTNDEDTLTVWSTVLNLPATEEAKLMRHLLEMNWTSTFEARFAIIDNQVVVVSTRTVAELSPGEVSRLITVVATIADENDETLKSQYGAS